MNHRHCYAVSKPLAGHTTRHHPAAYRNRENLRRVEYYAETVRWNFSTGFWLLEFYAQNLNGIEGVIAPIIERMAAARYNDERRMMFLGGNHD